MFVCCSRLAGVERGCTVGRGRGMLKSDRRLDVSNYGLLACMQTRLSALRQQRAVHDINIHVSAFGMTKGAWQSADDLETELLPQTDRRFVS
jgi:hypothetical protein